VALFAYFLFLVSTVGLAVGAIGCLILGTLVLFRVVE
jgi:hypothetical protein